MQLSSHRRARALAQSSAGVCALAALALSPPVPAACKLGQLAELPVTMRGAPLVPVAINGHATNMLVDTGAWKSSIWRPAAASFGLKIVSAGITTSGAGGRDDASMVDVRDFTLAGYTVHDLTLYAVGRGESGFSGLLGEDLLSKLDVEFDLPAGAIRLIDAKGCEGDQVVYWANSYFMLPLVRPPMNTNFIEAEVVVNGHELLALFDSGASSSTITTDAVKRPGMSPESTPSGAASDRGIAGKSIATEIGTFATVTIGQETIQHAPLRIEDLWGADRTTRTGSLIARSGIVDPDSPDREPDLVIGADFFKAHRIFIARNRKALYFTYTGGPIFRPQPKATPEAAAPAAEPKGDSPKP
jgi:predicted aspartyl protease